MGLRWRLTSLSRCGPSALNNNQPGRRGSPTIASISGSSGWGQQLEDVASKITYRIVWLHRLRQSDHVLLGTSAQGSPWPSSVKILGVVRVLKYGCQPSPWLTSRAGRSSPPEREEDVTDLRCHRRRWRWRRPSEYFIRVGSGSDRSALEHADPGAPGSTVGGVPPPVSSRPW